jgi:hypothetical protein
VAVVLLWQLLSSVRVIPADKLPPPTTIWHTAVSLVTTSSSAYAWAEAHLSVRASVWTRAGGLPLSVMDKAAADDAALAVPVTPAVVGSEQQVPDAFTAAGLIPVHVNFSGFVVTSFNGAVSPS